MKKNDKIAYFNLLKFIAALIIAIFLHYGDHLTRLLGITKVFPNNSFFDYITVNSYVLVEMFFMISGILFMIAYYNKISNGLNFRLFIRNRVIRIYPLLVITSIYMFIINIILFRYNRLLWEGGTLSLWNLFSDIMFAGKVFLNANNTLNGPIWYLNVLMICYILAFILTKLSKKYRTMYVFVVPIVLGIMIKYSYTSILLWNVNVARGLMSFFMGTLIAIFFKKYNTYSNRKKFFIKALLLAELTAFFFLLTRKTGNMYVQDNILSYTFLVFPELIILLYDIKILNKICKTKSVKFLGNISFGIYLWNFPILSTFFFLIINKIMKLPVLSLEFFILNIIVHIIVSSISYYLVDKTLIPFINKKL